MLCIVGVPLYILVALQLVFSSSFRLVVEQPTETGGK